MSANPPRVTGIGDEAAAALTSQVAAACELGWSALELRTVDGIPVGELGTRDFARVARVVREAGLEVVCLASRIGNWSRPITAPFVDDLRELDALIGQCLELGTRYIRIMSYPNQGLSEREWRDRVLDRITRLAERASARGVKLLHENCAGWAGSDPERMVELVRATENSAMRLLFDTGNGIAHGYDAAALLPRLLPHVAHVHIKDAVPTAGNVQYVLPGDGDAQVGTCVRLLREYGYTGFFSLEPHLATRPHEGVSADESDLERFLEAGRQFATLLNEQASTQSVRHRASRC